MFTSGLLNIYFCFYIKSYSSSKPKCLGYLLKIQCIQIFLLSVTASRSCIWLWHTISVKGRHLCWWKQTPQYALFNFLQDLHLPIFQDHENWQVESPHLHGSVRHCFLIHKTYAIFCFLYLETVCLILCILWFCFFK